MNYLTVYDSGDVSFVESIKLLMRKMSAKYVVLGQHGGWVIVNHKSNRTEKQLSPFDKSDAHVGSLFSGIKSVRSRYCFIVGPCLGVFGMHIPTYKCNQYMTQNGSSSLGGAYLHRYCCVVPLFFAACSSQGLKFQHGS
jgi:hypothetical protein